MMKILVEVIDIPVRYNKKTYQKGELFQVDAAHVDLSSMKKVGEVSNDQTDFFVGETIVLGEDGLKEMSIDGLKDYAKSLNIKLGRASSKEGIIDKILKAQNTEV